MVHFCNPLRKILYFNLMSYLIIYLHIHIKYLKYFFKYIFLTENIHVLHLRNYNRKCNNKWKKTIQAVPFNPIIRKPSMMYRYTASAWNFFKYIFSLNYVHMMCIYKIQYQIQQQIEIEIWIVPFNPISRKLSFNYKYLIYNIRSRSII